jgi:glycine/D-amino acid oxidase-like deaminating enzyme
VLATNGYADSLLPALRRTVVPVFSAIVASAPLAPTLAARILPQGAALYEVGAITTYYRIDRAGRLLMGGRSLQRDMTTLPEFTHLVRYARQMWPELDRAAWTHCWNGQVALTSDHYPHFHEPMPGVIACLGYNGRGVAMATVMGAQIAQRIAGKDIDMPITTIKSIPFHGLWRQATALRIAYGRIRDYLDR